MISIKNGNLEVRLATTEEELDAIYFLRYKVFHEELHSPISQEGIEAQREKDDYDNYCQHLLVIDHDLGENLLESAVGTYRLISQETADQVGGFYSSHEYDLTKLINNYKGKVLELGRTAITPSHRDKNTISLLWQGLAQYVVENNIDLLFGCASAIGLDYSKYAESFSYLYHYHRIADEYLPTSVPYTSMNLMPKEDINEKRAVKNLPTLIKGYLRVNGKFGDGLYVDKDFNTTDVFVMVETEMLSDRYKKHYLKNIEETELKL